MSSERVQKILAQAGIASRRKAEEMITEGLVTINGQVAKLGDRAEFGKDAIKVKGKLIGLAEDPVYVAFYKPRGVISMMEDPQGRPNLSTYLNKVRGRIFPIGRLDFNSEGILLLTNDGAFAEKIQKHDDIPRVYHVKVKGHPDAEMISRVARGAKMDKGFVKPHTVRVSEELTSKAFVEVVMMGGGATDIQAMFENKGFLVDRVIRSAIGHINLAGLPPGDYKLLKASAMQALLDQPELAMNAIEKTHEDLDEKDERKAVREEKRLAREEAREKRVAALSRARGGDRDGEERPARGSFGDKPARGSFGDKPARRSFGDKPARGPRREFGDKPARGSFGDKPARGPRSDFGDKPAPRGPRRDFGDKPAPRGPRRDFGDKPAPRGPRRDFGDKPARGSFGEKAPRSFGDKPAPRGSFGDKPARGPRRDFGDKAPRAYGDKPARGGFGGKPSGGSFGGKPSRGGPRAGGPRKPSGPKR